MAIFRHSLKPLEMKENERFAAHWGHAVSCKMAVPAPVMALGLGLIGRMTGGRPQMHLRLKYEFPSLRLVHVYVRP